MAIGLAFVDIVGDTSRTAEQVERDMTRVLAVVEEDLDPLDIQAAVAAGTEQDLVRDLNQDIRAAQAAINAVQVDARLDSNTQAELTAGLRAAIQQSRARLGEIEVRVNADQPARDARRALDEVAAQVALANARIPQIEIETNVDSDRFQRALSGIGSAAASAIKPVAALGAGLVAFGAAVPSLFSIVVTLENMAPAASLAAPAILSVASAVGAIKLATVGIGDAVKAAFDPSDPEAYAEALKKLSPEAQKFVKELHSMQPALKAVQQGVQDRVFAGLSDVLSSLSVTVLPQLSDHLLATGDALNKMAQGVGFAAFELGESGVFGEALDGARAGLENLVDVPGKLVTAFGQLASAAAPQFDKLTAALAGGIGRATDKLSESFSSGGLSKAIDLAVEQFGLLFDVIGNVGKIFGDITSNAAGFQGALGVLASVTAEIGKFTGSDQAQEFFSKLFESVNLLLKQGLSLLGPALKVIGDAFVALQPGLNALISALGPVLKDILVALGPVFKSLAGAISSLAIALSPILGLLGDLIVAVLPVLIPLFDGLSKLFVQLAPVIATVVQIIGSLLVPILGLLPGLMQPFIDAVLKVTAELLPLFNDLLIKLQPSLLKLSEAFIDLAVQLGPVIAKIVDLASDLLVKFLPLLQPIIDLIADLANIFSTGLAEVIRDVVMPALNTLTSFLKGDLQGTVGSAKTLLLGLGEVVADVFKQIPILIGEVLAKAVTSAYNIGRDIISSLIDGLNAKLFSLGNVLEDITQTIIDKKGPPERDRRLLTPAGQSIMDGLIDGIASRKPELASQLSGITSMIDGTDVGGLSVGIGGVPVPSSASGFSAASAPRTVSDGVPNVQVFIGQQQLTDIVDVRVAQVDRVQARQLSNGNGFRR